MPMTRKYFFALLALLFCLAQETYAQTLKSLEKAGDKAYAGKDYYTALVYFADALTIEPDNPAICFKYAEVARQFNAYERASEYYQKAIKTSGPARFPTALFWLASVEKSLGRYEEARGYFQDFINLNSTEKPDALLARARKELKACREAARLSAQHDPLIQVSQLGREVNTVYSEFSPILRNDTLYYASFRFEMEDDKHRPKRRISRMMWATGGERGRTMGSQVNPENRLAGNATFSPDGRRLYYTICAYVGAAGIQCQIYFREKDKRNRWSKEAVPLPMSINTPGISATHPAIGVDSLSGKTLLFFSSARPDGRGGADIWMTRVEGETFSEPINLEILNTSGEEMSPFFHSTTQTLYFASDGLPGLGGIDVFKSAWDGESFSEPELLPAPVNTSYNDLYYTLDESGRRGFLSSNRPGSFFLDPENKACCNDIYAVDIQPAPTVKEEAPATADSLPASATLVPVPDKPFVPQTLEDFLPLALYFDNDEPDKRTSKTLTKKTYSDTYYRYYGQKQVYLREYSRPVDEEAKAEAEMAMESFFEEEVKKGHDHLALFSEILYERLQAGERVEIFIKGFTSPRAKSDYNLALGKRRVSSVRNHFRTYKDGLFLPYLNSGKLVITERSFGEAQAAAGVSDDLEDLRNSVYSIGAARERRVEILEVKRD